jgi:DNA-binding NarL/FixJ family response regulator
MQMNYFPLLVMLVSDTDQAVIGDHGRWAVSPRRGSAPPGVLVVANAMFAELLHGALAECDDIEVIGVVTDASEAVLRSTEISPDVAVVADFAGQPGVTIAARLLRAIPGIRVIILTNSTSDSQLRAALYAGCTGFVTKDQSFAELVQAVRAVHEGVTVVDPKTIKLAVAQDPRRRGSDPGRLTQRESDVLDLLARGFSTAVIADGLFISMNTARNHIQRLLTKLGAHSRIEAVAIGNRLGLIGPEVETGADELAMRF